MRLSCWKIFLPLFASVIACTDTTGPSTVSAHFVLESINGRPLPTYLAITPGPSSTIFSSTLTLDKAGTAVITEHRDDMLLGERTYTSSTSYRIHGLQIEIDAQSCLAYPNCIGDRAGKIFNGRLSLNINPRSQIQIIYDYRASDNP
jgi:hypothetical protein